jgi:16S rRNA U516 pseudouridylate synthase RsuA-like enzyme
MGSLKNYKFLVKNIFWLHLFLKGGKKRKIGGVVGEPGFPTKKLKSFSVVKYKVHYLK